MRKVKSISHTTPWEAVPTSTGGCFIFKDMLSSVYLVLSSFFQSHIRERFFFKWGGFVSSDTKCNDLGCYHKAWYAFLTRSAPLLLFAAAVMTNLFRFQTCSFSFYLMGIKGSQSLVLPFWLPNFSDVFTCMSLDSLILLSLKLGVIFFSRTSGLENIRMCFIWNLPAEDKLSEILLTNFEGW